MKQTINKIGKRYSQHATVECISKLDIVDFNFETYQKIVNFKIPRAIRISREQLEIEQFVYTLTEYNNFREGQENVIQR